MMYSKWPAFLQLYWELDIQYPIILRSKVNNNLALIWKGLFISQAEKNKTDVGNDLQGYQSLFFTMVAASTTDARHWMCDGRGYV